MSIEIPLTYSICRDYSADMKKQRTSFLTTDRDRKVMDKIARRLELANGGRFSFSAVIRMALYAYAKELGI